MILIFMFMLFYTTLQFLHEILPYYVSKLAKTNLSFTFKILKKYHKQHFVMYFFLFFNLFIFKYKFIHFNWRLITLQYCSGFSIYRLNFISYKTFKAQVLVFD